MRTFLLDADTCIYALNGRYPAIVERLRSHAPEEIGLPSLVLAELLTGALKSRRPERTLDVVRRFTGPLQIVPFHANAAEQYGRIRAALESTGTPIGPSDLIIAATALTAQATLVTHNVKEFARVPGLICEDWTLGT